MRIATIKPRSSPVMIGAIDFAALSNMNNNNGQETESMAVFRCCDFPTAVCRLRHAVMRLRSVEKLLKDLPGGFGHHGGMPAVVDSPLTGLPERQSLRMVGQ